VSVFIFPLTNLGFERKNVKQSKIIKIEKNQNNLIRLLEHQSPEERQEFLNDIDYILCRFLKFKRKDLPWRNLGKQNEKFEKVKKFYSDPVAMAKAKKAQEKKEAKQLKENKEIKERQEKAWRKFWDKPSPYKKPKATS